MALGSEVGPSEVCTPSLVSLLCVSAELYPNKLDDRNHQCLDDRTFIRTSAISPAWYVYRMNLQDLSNVLVQALVSITLTVLEIQFTKVKVSGASSYQVLYSQRS